MAKPLESSNTGSNTIQNGETLPDSSWGATLGALPQDRAAPKKLPLPVLPAFFPLQTILVWVWMGLGLWLRLRGLDLKPAWGDEWSTLVFSLGNGYHNIPLNETIALETLLQPLQPPDHLQWGAVIDRLRQESNHPPLFFGLLHLWLSRFPPMPGGFVSIAAARLFSVLFGVAAIPVTFALVRSWTSDRVISGDVFPRRVWDSSFLSAHLCALWMALSPFGVYLSQEARHYTLSVLWILGLLFFLLKTIAPLERLPEHKLENQPEHHHLDNPLNHQRQPLSWPLVFLWILLNSVGIGTHFFYGIALVATGGVIAWHWLNQSQKQIRAYEQRLLVVAAGTIATMGVWIPVWQSLEETSLTQWLGRHEWFAPLGRLVLWILTTIMLLPVEGVPQPVAIGSGLVLILSFVVTIVVLIRPGSVALDDCSSMEKSRDFEPRPGSIRGTHPIQILAQFVGLNLSLFLILIYGLGNDLSLAPRYQFVYFPAIVLVFGLRLAQVLYNAVFRRLETHRLPIVFSCGLLLLSLGGSLSVTSNWAYQKSEQSDRFLSKLTTIEALKNPTQPWLLATAHRDHGDTGRLMGLAWQWNDRRQEPDFPFADHPEFLLAHWQQDPLEATEHLHAILQQKTEPYLLGLINFSAPHEVEPFGCSPLPHKSAPGYWSRFYSCTP